MSTLGFALLALLAKQSNTAYELAQRARRPLGYFWTASYSQIHPQLRELTASGLLDVVTSPGPGPHDKRVYSITPAGRAALAEWVVLPPRVEPTRDELLLKTYALWTAPPAAARALILDQLAAARAELAEYESIKSTMDKHVAAPGHPRPDEPDFGSVATLRYGIGSLRHRIEWCEWLVAQLTSAIRQSPRG